MTYKTEYLIDVTSMGRINAEHLLQAEITCTVEVIDCELAEVGDLMLDKTDSPETVRRTKELVSRGKLKIEFSPYTKTIPLSNAVRCIRIEPFYIIQDLKKKYEQHETENGCNL